MKSLKYLIFAFVISFVTLSSASAEVCTYTGTVDGQEFTYRCNISNGINCGFIGGVESTYKFYNNGVLSDANDSSIRKIRRTDFLDSEGNIDCSLVNSFSIDMNVLGNMNLEVYDIGENISCGIASSVYNSNRNGYIASAVGCTTFTLERTNEEESNGGSFNEGSGGSRGDDPNSGIVDEINGSNDNDFTPESFCNSEVQGVFTTLGWIFFFLKILIPIILIVFGCIDLGKAVISSKDDEIKKSTKKLVVRAIAGIVIFFVPTLLNFVVELASEDNLYNGSFATCTYCMLEPTDDACRRLIGD